MELHYGLNVISRELINREYTPEHLGFQKAGAPRVPIQVLKV